MESSPLELAIIDFLRDDQGLTTAISPDWLRAVASVIEEIDQNHIAILNSGQIDQTNYLAWLGASIQCFYNRGVNQATKEVVYCKFEELLLSTTQLPPNPKSNA